MAFFGFPASAIRFLSELSRNNDRAWFDAHREDYEGSLFGPARELVEALGPRLREIDPKIQASPREHGSIKAMERRQRFRAGPMLPYRETLDLWFWAGRRRMWDNSGFFVRLTPTRLILAAGMIEFQKDTLARYRERVLDDERGAALAEVVERVRALGYVIGGESYKKAPRGTPAEHARASLLKHGGLFATLDADHPAELATPAFVDLAAAHFARMAPLHAWLVELGRASGGGGRP